MTYLIDKSFELCYGHRVWTQKLNGVFSNDLKCACRHLHGHEAKIQVFLESEKLTDSMVTDFRHTEWLKKALNTYVDHRFILDRNDPLFDHLTMGGEQKPYVELKPVMFGMVKVGYEFDSSKLVGDSSILEKELLDGFLVVDFVPTSENLVKWLYDIVNPIMKPLNVTCTRVDWWETPKSRSSYRA